jgi:hypothetical protein
MSTFKIRAARVIRGVAATDPRLEGLVRKLYLRPKLERGQTFLQRTGRNYLVVTSRSAPDGPRVGIYLRGGCDLPAMFSLAPLLRERPGGSCAIFRDPNQIAGSRSDFLLQSLLEFSPEARSAMNEVRNRLRLKKTYFGSELFAPTFRIPPGDGAERYPRSVVVLSAGPDFTRVMYRHRQHGFLVDPGGFWLQSDMARVLKDMAGVEWFRSNFESIGRFTIEDFRRSFGRLVDEVRDRTKAHILVFNLLAVDPNETMHSYRIGGYPDTARRRHFNIALTELAAAHDFDVVDVDRIAKLDGVSDQVDFAHFSERQFGDIAAEAHRILVGRSIL